MVHDTAALAVQGLHKRYGSGAGAVNALVGVDLASARGTFTAIMGPSGSGKSTFLACVAGLDRPTAGRIWLDGTARSQPCCPWSDSSCCGWSSRWRPT